MWPQTRGQTRGQARGQTRGQTRGRRVRPQPGLQTIRELPSELFKRILEMHATAQTFDEKPKNLKILEASLVCQTWYQTVIDTPQYWQELTLGREDLALYSARCRSLPLTIIIDHRSPLDDLGHICLRDREISFVLHNGPHTLAVLLNDQNPLHYPKLSRLRLALDEGLDHDDLEALVSPSLKDFRRKNRNRPPLRLRALSSLRSFEISAHAKFWAKWLNVNGVNLTTLRVVGELGGYNFAQLLGFLGGMPGLQNLYLMDEGYELSRERPPQELCQLPALRRLELGLIPQQQFLSAIHAPLLDDLRLSALIHDDSWNFRETNYMRRFPRLRFLFLAGCHFHGEGEQRILLRRTI